MPSKMWDRANSVILDGNSLLSKRPERWLPELWPSHYISATGVSVLADDGIEYLDCSLMGVGCCFLGYGNAAVDSAVVEAVRGGVASSLNPFEEVLLAEQLLALNPGFSFAKFARTGGEINAQALRYARAITGKSRALVCGYHGWHDWYLSINTKNPNGLQDLLLPGISPLGIEASVRTVGFTYNNVGSFDAAIDKFDDFAVCFLELYRWDPPSLEFIARVESVCRAKGIVLVVDECTSGFRNRLGGIYRNYGFQPDIVTFGKALGNGYAITAMVMTEEFKALRDKIFVSSTFWSERLGFTAGLATIKQLELTNPYPRVLELGRWVKAEINAFSEKNGLKVAVGGMDSLISFKFATGHDLKRTILSKNMLANGILGTNCIYISAAHEKHHLERYLGCLEQCFSLFSSVSDEELARDYLSTPVARSDFGRL